MNRSSIVRFFVVSFLIGSCGFLQAGQLFENSFSCIKDSWDTICPIKALKYAHPYKDYVNFSLTDLQAHFQKRYTFVPDKTYMALLGIDLKYTTDKKVKIVEFQVGKSSSQWVNHTPMNHIYKPTYVWNTLWRLCSDLFGKEIFFVLPVRSENRQSITYSTWDLEYLKKIGGRIFSSAQDLESKVNLAALKKGLIVSPINEMDPPPLYEAMQGLEKRYPQLTVLDGFAWPFTEGGRCKLLQRCLIESVNPDAQPRWHLVNKDDLKGASDNYINHVLFPGGGFIKPFDSSGGVGITAVNSKHSLTSALQSVFWKWKSRGKFLLLEELVKSKAVFHEGKSYDPTMRVYFLIALDKFGNCRCKAYGHYWKTPRFGLDESGKSLSDRHKSGIVGTRGTKVLPVAAEDIEVINKELRTIFCPVYRKMLEATALRAEGH